MSFNSGLGLSITEHWLSNVIMHCSKIHCTGLQEDQLLRGGTRKEEKKVVVLNLKYLSFD